MILLWCYEENSDQYNYDAPWYAYEVAVKDDVTFVHVVEHGALEHQSVLLVNSLRKFGGEFKDCTVFAISPRGRGNLSPQTIKEYRKLGVRFVSIALNTLWKEYPFVNTSYAAAYVEGIQENQAKYLVLLDTDVIFTSEPRELILNGEEKVGLRPIDTTSEEIAFQMHEQIPLYWKEIFSVCGNNPENIWEVRTTLDKVMVTACFNNGVVVSAISNKLFTRCIQGMEKALAVPYFRNLDRSSLEWHYLDQTFLSSVIMRDYVESEVKVLEEGYNYPFSPRVLAEESDYGFRNVSVLHYHSMFYRRAVIDRFRNNEELFSFLAGFLPLPVNVGAGLFTRVVDAIPVPVRKWLRNSFLFPVIKDLARILNIYMV